MTDEQWLEQVVALRAQIASEAEAIQVGALREQTAATILAALIEPDMGGTADVTEGCRTRVAYAVALADALRAELAKPVGP